MELFSALVLVCSVATGEGRSARAVNLPVMHTEQRECLRQLNMLRDETMDTSSRWKRSM